MSGLALAMVRGAMRAGVRWAVRRTTTAALLAVAAAAAALLVTHQSPAELGARAQQLVRSHLPGHLPVLGAESAAAAPSGGSLSRLASTSPAAARQQLARLRVAADLQVPYSRAGYGKAWADVDGNGCNQRDDVLLRDARLKTARTGRQGSCSHDVLAGVWGDPYTGQVIKLSDLKVQRQAQAITNDHLVPLKEAHRSGGASWPAARRAAFANDLHNLLAVGGSENSAKGDGDPATWMPQLRSARCAYVEAYIGVKTRWQLSVDPAERKALTTDLSRCWPTSKPRPHFHR